MASLYAVRNEIQAIIDASSDEQIKRLGEVALVMARSIEDLETKFHHEEQVTRALRSELTQMRSSVARLR